MDIAGAAGLGVLSGCKTAKQPVKRPNVVYVFADQWRASAMGYAGDPNVKTPHLDALATESFQFKNAVFGICDILKFKRSLFQKGQHFRDTPPIFPFQVVD